MSMKMAKEALDLVTKSFSEAAGSTGNSLISYNLDSSIAVLYPDTVKVIKYITKEYGGQGASAEFDVVTKNNVGNARGILQRGKTGAVNRLEKKRYSQVYKSFGDSGEVILQDELEHGGLSPERKALEVNGMMHTGALIEERLVIGGNRTSNLVRPVLTASVAAGGSVAAGDYKVQVVALNYQAYIEVRNALVADIAIQSTVAITDVYGNASSTEGGHSQPSAASTVTTTTTNKTINVTWPVDVNAFGYAVYAGPAAGDVVLQKITNINSVSLTELVTDTQNITALTNADKSVETQTIDGMLTQILKDGSGATVKVLATGTAGVGSTLTKGSRNNCVEFDEVLTEMYQKKMIVPKVVILSVKLFKKLADTMGDSLIRFSVPGNANGEVTLGSTVSKYIHPNTGSEIEIISALEFPDVVLFAAFETNYGQGGDVNTVVVDYRKGHTVNFWPIMDYTQKFSLIYDFCVKVKYPGAFGVITNIAVD